jgi:hypothetical protein
MPAPDRDPGAPAATLPARVLVSILAVGAVAGPYLLRSLDDNRLTSWRWVFGARNPAVLFALVAAAAVLAQLLTKRLPAGRTAEAATFLGAYAIGAAFWSAPEPIVDAARYFTQAKHLALYGIGHFFREWGGEIPAWTDLPLVPSLYGIVLRLSGESRLAVQAFTTLLFAGSAVLTCRIGTALWDEEVGLAAGAFLLAIPYLFTQVPLLLVDVPTQFFVTLAVYAAILAFRHGGTGRILLASAAIFLALLSKYSAGLLLSVLPAVGVVHAKESGVRRALFTGAMLALVTGGLVLAAVLPHREVYGAQLRLLLDYQAPGLRRWGESFLSTFLFQVHPFLSAAALASIWLAIRRRDLRWVIVAWPVLLLVGLEVRRIRYLLPAFPMLALLAAHGLRILRARETRRLVLACAVLSSLAVALYGYLPFLRSTSAMNVKRAGAYLDALEERRVEVFTLSRPEPDVNPAVAVPILDLFTAKALVHRTEGISPTPGRGMETSALRFTWDYRSPRYYAAGGAEEAAAVAVVTDDLGRALPEHVARRLEGHRLARAFTDDEGVFGYKTLVLVYRAAPSSDLEPAPP